MIAQAVTPPAGVAAASDGEAWFVYGLLPVAGVAPAGAAILPESRVETLPLAGLAALAARAPRRLFDRDDPANRTADPDWMGARVEAYHAINAAAAAAGPFLPLAFGTLFSSLDRLGDWLAPRAPALQAALARIAGRSEWQLTVHADAAAHAAWLDAHDPALRDLVAAVAAAAEGTAFLLTRRLEKTRAAAQARHLAAVATTVATALDSIATPLGLDVLVEPPRGGLPAWTVLAPQIASGDALGWPARLEQAAVELAPTGLSLRLTGPWPAYAYARAALAEEAKHG